MITRVRAFAQLLVLFACSFTAFSQSLVCREKGIAGMDANASRAEQFLPPNTSNMSEAVVYVEKTARGLYFHSNYVTPRAPNPTKIVTKDTSDFGRVFVNIAYFHSTYTEQQLALTEFRKHVKLLLDESVFTEGGYPLVDVRGAENVSVVNGNTGKVLIGDIKRLDTVSPPPVLMSRIVGCCLYGIPPHLAARYQELLAARSLRKSDVRFLSLVRDTGTQSAISQSTHLQQIGDSNSPITSLNQIESAFQQAKNTTVVLLSHVEGTNFVTRSPAGAIVAEIPMDSVRNLASKYNIQLVDLGCETAQKLKAEKLGLAVATRFNTVDAVRALDRALSQSSNYSEFFQALTSENLKIVVDHGFMLGWPLCADIYSRATTRAVWVKLARVFVNFRQN